MLEDIQASRQTLLAISIDDATQAHQLPVAARLFVSGHTRADFHLSDLQRALSLRFAYLSPDQLYAELFTPLKRGLGNAYKWGNLRDTRKRLRMEIVVTAEGVVVEIQDEGAGFDVGQVVRRLQEGDHYYSNQGKGFAHFNKMRSIVSYADGGRTFLLCFLRFPQIDSQYRFLGDAVDPRIMGARLASAIPPGLCNSQRALQTCHIYVPESKAVPPPELKYTVMYRDAAATESDNGSANCYMRLTGRLLPSDDAATDYGTAASLVQRGYNQQGCSQIPTPVAHMEDLGLVLYGFMPHMNLRKFASRCQDATHFIRVVQQIGAGLRRFHELAAKMPDQGSAYPQKHGVSDSQADTISALIEQVAKTDLHLAQTMAQLYADVQPELQAIAPLTKTVIHGDFSWINIKYDEERFYFYHFEAARQAHPGFDLGGFLADLCRFCMIQEPDKLAWYQPSHNAFLDAYFDDAIPDWYSALPFFTVDALLLSLPRLLKNSPKKWYKQLDAYVEVCYGMKDRLCGCFA